MKRVAALTLLLSLLALLVPATAEAKWPRVDRAKAVAAAVFGKRPACERVWTIKVSPDELESLLAGHAGAAMAAAGCVVWLDREWYFYTASWQWPLFCSYYVHEYGHLLGRNHVSGRRDVMNSTPAIIPACKRRADRERFGL